MSCVHLCGVFSTTCNLIITIHTSHEECSANSITHILELGIGKYLLYTSCQVIYLICMTPAKYTLILQLFKTKRSKALSCRRFFMPMKSPVISDKMRVLERYSNVPKNPSISTPSYLCLIPQSQRLVDLLHKFHYQ